MLTGALKELKQEMRMYALSYGLDFFEVEFQVLEYDALLGEVGHIVNQRLKVDNSAAHQRFDFLPALPAL